MSWEEFHEGWVGVADAEEAMNAVKATTSTRPKTKAAANSELESLLRGAGPQEAATIAATALSRLRADGVTSWAGRLGEKVTRRDDGAAVIMRHYFGGEGRSIAKPACKPEMTPPREPVATPAQAARRREARYFEDSKPTTRQDYHRVEINRLSKGELHVKGACPSCGAVQEFSDATKRQLGSVASVFGGHFTSPMKTLADVFTSAEGMEMSCSKCSFGVTICGHCDQINSHNIKECSWCGNAML